MTTPYIPTAQEVMDGSGVPVNSGAPPAIHIPSAQSILNPQIQNSVSGELKNLWNNILSNQGQQNAIANAKPNGSTSSNLLETAKVLGSNALAAGKGLIGFAEEPFTQEASDLVNAGKNVITGLKEGTPDSIGAGLIHSVLTQPLELISNTSSVDGSPLTPNQKASNIQDVLSLVVAHKVGLATRESAIGGLASPVAPSGIGNLAKIIGINAATGAGAGASQAAVANLGSPDYLDSVVGGAVIGGGLGGFMGAMFPKSTQNALEKGMMNARDAAAMKTIITNGQSSIQDALASKAAVLSSDNLGQAIIKAKILKVGDTAHITGMSQQTAIDMETHALSTGQPIQIWKHLNADESVNVIASADPVLQGEALFQKTGLIPNQKVSYQGRDFTVKGISGGNVILDDGSGKTVPVDPSLVRGKDSFAFGLDKNQLTDKLYDGFKKEAFGGDPGSFDPSSVPDWSIEQSLGKYLSKISLAQPSEAAGMGQLFLDRLKDDMFKTLDPATKKLYYDAALATSNDIETWGFKNFANLTKAAVSNGMDIDANVNGYVIKDIRSGEPLHVANNMSSAFDYIAKNQQLETLDLDNANAQMAGRHLYPLFSGPGKPFSVIPDILKPSFGQKLIAGARTGLAGLKDFAPVRIHEFAQSIETNAPEFLATQQIDKLEIANSAMQGPLNAYQNNLTKIDRIAGKLPEDRLALISQWLETDSDKNLRAQRTDLENQLVDKYSGVIRDSNGNIRSKNPLKAVDATKIFRYRTVVNDIQNKYSPLLEKAPDPQTQQLLAKSMNKEILNQQQNIGMNGLHLKAYQDLENLRGMPTKIGKIYNVVRGINAITSNALDRGNFAKANNMSSMEQNVGFMLADHYANLATHFGIADSKLIQNYMTHVRVYTDGDMAYGARDFGGDPFYASLARTGQMDSWEMNPFKAARRYTNAGFQAKYLEPVISEVQDYVENNKSQLGSQAVYNTTRGMFDNYISKLKYAPSDIDKATNQATQKILGVLGIKSSDRIFSNIVSMINNTSAAAAIGFRPFIGLLHFMNNAAHTYVMVGADGLTSTLGKGFAAVLGDGRDDLVRRGILKETNPYTYMQNTAGDALSDQGARVTNQVASFTMKGTGLKQANDVWQAGTYLHTFGQVADVLQKTKDITKISQEVNLRSYDLPIRKQFLALLKLGRNEQAADYLGRQAVQIRIGMFDLANNPRLFQNNAGRLFGQFGNYPTFIVNQVLRTATNGTLADSFSRLVKLSAIAAMYKKIGDETGLDLSKFRPLHAFGYSGGPAVELYHSLQRVVTGDSDASSVFSGLFSQLNDDGTFRSHLYEPGSFALHSITGAIQDAQEGSNPWFVAAKAIGIPEEH